MPRGFLLVVQWPFLVLRAPQGWDQDSVRWGSEAGHLSCLLLAALSLALDLVLAFLSVGVLLLQLLVWEIHLAAIPGLGQASCWGQSLLARA